MELNITEEEKNILKEVANIGLGNASTAIQQLMNKPVKIEIPQLNVISKKDIYSYFKDTEVLLGLHLRLLEDLTGSIITLFNKDDALALIDTINNREPGTTKHFDDFQVSTIKEIANIITGAYADALADFSDLRILPSLPHLSFDTPASILTAFTESVFTNDAPIFLIKSNLEISDKSLSVKAMLAMVLNEEEAKKLLSKLKEKYPEKKN